MIEIVNAVKYCTKCGDALIAALDAGTRKHDGRVYCRRCFDDLFVICDACDNTAIRDDAHYTPTGMICDRCYTDHHFCCAGCKEISPNQYYGRDGYCVTCITEQLNDCECD